MDWHARISYPPAFPLLERLLDDVREALGDNLLGLYLSGSLSSGDFVPERSDVDFVAATRDPLPPDGLPVLAAMHRQITGSTLALADHLEGSYIPRQALHRYDPSNAYFPALRVDGSFGVDHHASDWIIQLHLLREQGVALYGPDPRELVDPVLPADLRRAAMGILREWWAPMLEDPNRLRSAEYQAYAVLTMCRSLYTLQHADVVPKAEAASWARAELGEPWTELIDQAGRWRAGQLLDRLDDVLALIRETLRRSQPFSL